MGNFNYIKVDFFGQFVSAAGASDTIHRFTYPVPKSNVDEPSNWWLDPITDPRNEIRLFNNADNCYKLLSNGYGTYCSLITRNRRDSRGGMVLITVMVEKGHRIEGKKMVKLLDMLKTEMLEADQWSNDIVERCLADCGFEPSQTASPAPKRQPSAGMSPARAIRLYVTPEEMEGYFSFPEQDAYKQFPGGILFALGQHKPLQAVVPIITAPLQRMFRIIKPKNCHVTGTATSLVKEGTPLRLTFKKDNLLSKPVKVVVGQNDALVSYNGSDMIITEKDGIVYYFPLVVKVSQDGRVVPPTQVKVNGSIGPRPINFTLDAGQQAQVGELFENDMDANINAKIIVNVSGNTFDPVKKELDMSQIGQPIIVNVVGRSQQVTIYHVAGGIRFSTVVDIKEGSPEAIELKQGKFRGHNVQRNADGTYNVIIAEKQPVKVVPATSGTAPDGEGSFKRYGKYIAMAVVGLLLAGLIVAGLLMWKGCDTVPGTSTRNDTIQGKTEEAKNRGNESNFGKQGDDSPEDLSADLDFLKKDDWELSQLKTQKYKDLFNYFVVGDIDGIINSDYPQQNPHNGWFDQIVSRLKQLSNEEKNNARQIMSDMASGGKFNIEALKKKLDGRLGSLNDAAQSGTNSGRGATSGGSDSRGSNRGGQAGGTGGSNRGGQAGGTGGSNRGDQAGGTGDAPDRSM